MIRDGRRDIIGEILASMAPSYRVELLDTQEKVDASVREDGRPYRVGDQRQVRIPETLRLNPDELDV